MASYRQPGTILTDLTFTVPLDHARPDAEQIELYARAVVSADPDRAAKPWLVFLQGGPGFGAIRPVGSESWIGRALDDFRVLLLDQRGTARSTPANRLTLERLGTPRAQADYLAHFRADSIIADAELVRRELTDGERWSVLGQSFGGFCATSYLSAAPDGLREVFITGGLPGLTAHADDVYRLTYQKTAAKNRAHYERYPQDIAQARKVAEHLAPGRCRLPNGAPLTVEAFQSLGIMLGFAAGSHTLHYMLEQPFAAGQLSDSFLRQVAANLSFAEAPLYLLLHEACYAQGAATRWSAQRIRAEFAEFDALAALDSGAPVLFTGEMVYPWMADNDPVLRPLAEAAQLLAERDGWPPLYDPARLAGNEVPAAAVIYFDDMYVPQELSVQTAAVTRGLRAWVTNEYEHDGLRLSNGRVLDRLIGLARGLV